MKLAVIPARGGSKRIPKKNIKVFCGQPIIAYSIQAALASQLFDRIIVSTDSEEIAEIACQYGAEVPFLRPEPLADDVTPTLTVIKQALLQTEQHYQVAFNEICCIYATAPFITSQTLTEGWQTLRHSQAYYSFAATAFDYPIFRAFRLNEQGRSEMFWAECYTSRSQDLETAYHDAGQFYWGLREAYINELPFLGPHSKPVILPKHLVQDIDDQSDWERAEWLYKWMKTYESSYSG